MITTENIEKIKSRLPEFISEKRMKHTLAVADEAKKLAEIFGMSEYDCERLYVAGLLHDITKECSFERQLEICKKFGETWSKSDEKSPKVFHSVTGALMARKLFPETADDEICLAIRSHTTGREDMTLSEKILYLADYIEPTRTFPDCVELRKMFYAANDFTVEHLDRILLASFDMTLTSLISDGAFVHEKTVSARNFLLK